jgi:hypothetical protein
MLRSGATDEIGTDTLAGSIHRMANYELHLTFASYIDLITFFHKALRLQVKPLLISVPNAAQNLQPMYALRQSFTNDDAAMRWAKFNQEKLYIDAVQIYRPIRVKLECELLTGDAVYFEGHWKSETPFPKTTLKYLRSYGYVPQAYYLTRRDSDPVIASVINPYKFHSERVLYDSNPSIDKGWVEE